MEINLGAVKLHISFFATIFFALMLNGNAATVYLSVFASALLHELTHLIFLRLFGCKKVNLFIVPCGARFSSAEMVKLSYEKILLCALSAPVMNIIIAAVCFLLFKVQGYMYLKDISLINFTLGIGNMLPVSFLDGGRALNAIMNMTGKTEFSQKNQNIVNIFFLFLFIFVSVFLLLNKKVSFSLIAFTIYLFINIISSKSF